MTTGRASVCAQYKGTHASFGAGGGAAREAGMHEAPRNPASNLQLATKITCKSCNASSSDIHGNPEPEPQTPCVQTVSETTTHVVWKRRGLDRVGGLPRVDKDVPHLKPNGSK
jgi:hypothetical protein